MPGETNYSRASAQKYYSSAPPDSVYSLAGVASPAEGAPAPAGPCLRAVLSAASWEQRMTAQTETAGAAKLHRLVERATALETDGDLDGAVNVYEEGLLAGLASDEICYNLALLYKQQLLFEDALTLLARCLDSPEYGASAHYASGECQLALGSLAAAGEHFDRAVNRLALDRIPAEQVSEVSHVLRVAIDTHTSLDNQERAAALSKTLANFLAAHGLSTPPADTSRPGGYPSAPARAPQ